MFSALLSISIIYVTKKERTGERLGSVTRKLNKISQKVAKKAKIFT
jgi:hypothetical protein